MVQLWKLSKESWHFCGVTTQPPNYPFLILFYFFLNCTLAGCPYILPLGVLCSINTSITLPFRLPLPVALLSLMIIVPARLLTVKHSHLATVTGFIIPTVAREPISAAISPISAGLQRTIIHLPIDAGALRSTFSVVSSGHFHGTQSSSCMYNIHADMTTSLSFLIHSSTISHSNSGISTYLNGSLDFGHDSGRSSPELLAREFKKKKKCFHINQLPFI